MMRSIRTGLSRRVTLRNMPPPLHLGKFSEPYRDFGGYNCHGARQGLISGSTMKSVAILAHVWGSNFQEEP